VVEQSHGAVPVVEDCWSCNVVAGIWSELIEELNAYELRPDSEDDDAEFVVNDGKEMSEWMLCALDRLFDD